MITDDEIEKLKQEVIDLSQWIVDLDEGLFIDSSDSEYFMAVEKAKANLKNYED